MSEGDSIARVRDVRKSYGTLKAVDGVSFAMARGEIFGLLGPNGAGKTTTISMLAGILAPDSGEIEVAGHDVKKAGIAMKKAIGVVPQELAIYPKLTGRENLEFFGHLYGLHGPELQARIVAMLELVGLADRAGSFVGDYSGGMKRRLNLAAGLMHNPLLLLLDEPTVGVDPQSRNHIFEGVKALNRQGLTVLYTSHYMEEVEGLCDRVGIMDGGKLIACDTIPNLIAGLGGAVIEVGLETAHALPALANAVTKLNGVEKADFLPTNENEVSAHATLLVRTPTPNHVLPGLVTALNAANAPLLSLNIKQPNLEDVFLSLTGKTLRD